MALDLEAVDRAGRRRPLKSSVPVGDEDQEIEGREP
jgi:hypothetical protein